MDSIYIEDIVIVIGYGEFKVQAIYNNDIYITDGTISFWIDKRETRKKKV